jgi:hypothetical protein
VFGGEKILMTLHHERDSPEGNVFGDISKEKVYLLSLSWKTPSRATRHAYLTASAPTGRAF